MNAPLPVMFPRWRRVRLVVARPPGVAAPYQADEVVDSLLHALGALGCAVVPGGVGNTELQLDAIAAIKPAGYVGTPSFLKILVEKAAELGKDISSIKHAFVGAEALGGFQLALSRTRAENYIVATVEGDVTWIGFAQPYRATGVTGHLGIFF